MKKEDIEFLRDLQHELNTQEHDEQKEPRYWGIAENIMRPTPEGCGDAVLYVGDGGVMTCEEFAEWIERDKYYEGHEEEWSEVDVKDINDLETFARYVLKWKNVRIVWQEMKHHCIGEDSNVFLTKRACKAHIEANRHHYSQPHTYAMTAWRNPEFERLLKILMTMNLDDVKITE